MLNECKEYELYVESPVQNFRLKYDSLIKKQTLGGIRRPLVIIARHELFKETDNPGLSDFRHALNAMENWCNYPLVKTDKNDNKTCAEKRDDLKPQKIKFSEKNYYDLTKKCTYWEDTNNLWLYKYLDSLTQEYFTKKDCPISKELEEYINADEKDRFESGKAYLDSETSDHAKKAFNRFLKARKSLRDGSSSGFKYFNLESNRNDANAIKYEDLLAEAYHAGPLKEYYLIADVNWKDNLRIENKNGEIKTIGSSTEDKVLKIISYYMLTKKDYGAQNSVYIKRPDIANWFVGKSGLNSIDSLFDRLYSQVDEELRPLINKNPIGPNKTKIDIDKSVLSKFKLVEKEEYDKKKYAGRLLYKDEYVKGNAKLTCKKI